MTSPVTTRLVSFLGTGPTDVAPYYNEVVYTRAEKRSQLTPLVQSAICQLHDVTSAQFFGSGKVEERWLSSPEPLLDRYVDNAIYHYKNVPTGRSFDELVRLFSILVDTLSIEPLSELGESRPPDRIILDVSHGYRIQPMIGLAAVSYIQSQWRRQQIKHPPTLLVLYGAFAARNKVTNETPIWDLSPFLQFASWNDAFNALIRFGHAEDLQQLIEGMEFRERVDVRAQEEHERVNWLRGLGKHAVPFANDLATMRITKISKSSAELLRVLEDEHAKSWLKTYPFLKEPVNALHAQVESIHCTNLCSIKGIKMMMSMARHLILQHKAVQAFILCGEIPYVMAGLLLTSGQGGLDFIYGAGKSYINDTIHKNARVIDLHLSPSTIAQLKDIADYAYGLKTLRNSVAHAGLQSSAPTAKTMIESTTKRYEQLERLVIELERTADILNIPLS